MVRRSKALGSLFVLVAAAVSQIACTSSPPPPAVTDLPPPRREPEFATPEMRETACERLRDHVIVLFADEWARRQGLPPTTMTDEERDALYAGFTQAMNEKGTLARFTASCTASLTPRKFQCGMRSKTGDGLISCMHASG
jgi:hypothetical protein